jgi:hypothetical protein
MQTPWQSFRIDLERAPIRLWSALGRLEAYGETLTALPAAPATAAALTRDWRERAALATFAAEPGARDAAAALDPELAAMLARLYDDIDRRDETRDGGRLRPAAVSARPARDVTRDGTLSPQTLCSDNAALAELARAAGIAGEGGEGSLADQLAEGPASWARLSQLCTWLNGPEFDAQPGDAVQTAVLQALGAHLFLLRLSPFRHCNEATARLAGYRLLRGAGLPAMAAHLPTAHFAATAERYGELIAEAAEPGGATFAFIAYAVGGIADGMRRQIAALARAQRANAWRDTVADAFAGRSRTGDSRRRMLIDALGREAAPVRIGRLRYLTPKLAEAYAGKSEKTLSRDVKWLEGEGLVRRTLQGVAACADKAA